MSTTKKKIKFTLGLVGPICAGKETVGEYLRRKYKVTYYSLSDTIRDELSFLGFGRHSRELLQAIGIELRHHRGPDYLARRIVDKMKRTDHGFTVIGSIRNPEEAHFLRENLPNFCLVGVDADQKVRFKRMKKRDRVGDSRDWEEFLKADERELDQQTKEIFQIQVGTALLEADFFIDNNLTKRTLYKNIDLLVNQTIKPSIRNRLSEVTIAVGSKNPVKIAAVKSVFEKLFPNVQVIGVEVGSGVATTPFSDEEAVGGGNNRAKEALKKTKARFAVGLEGGLKQVGEKYFLSNWAVVVSHSGKIGVGGGSEVPIPDKLIPQIRRKKDLGEIVDNLIGTKHIKTQVGVSGVLTKGLVHRFDETELAVSSALSKFISPEFYNRSSKRR